MTFDTHAISLFRRWFLFFYNFVFIVMFVIASIFTFVFMHRFLLRRGRCVIQYQFWQRFLTLQRFSSRRLLSTCLRFLFNWRLLFRCWFLFINMFYHLFLVWCVRCFV